MIIIGANAKYGDGHIEYWFQHEPDIQSAKAVTTATNERNYCDSHGIDQNWFEFHDTETNKSWSVFGIGLSKGNYMTEQTDSFIRRIKSMSLPTYDKAKRKKAFQQLPKGAYIIKIKDAKQDQWPSGDGVIRIAFDIAEGEYMGFYQNQFDNNANEDKKWPMDAVFNLNVPSDGCQQYVWDNWNTFFADLEDSNGGFVFGGDLKSLRGKVIGALFHNRQSEYKGTVYDHIVMKFTRPAEDVRTGKYGKLPNDKLIGDNGGTAKKDAVTDDTSFLKISGTAEEEELPF